MLFTVALEFGGYTPRIAVIAGPAIAEAYADQLRPVPKIEKIEGDIWIIAPPAEADNPVCQINSYGKLAAWEQNEKNPFAPMVFFKMNASRLVRRFEQALALNAKK